VGILDVAHKQQTKKSEASVWRSNACFWLFKLELFFNKMEEVK